MSERLDEREAAWPLRPWALAAICAAAGVVFHALVDHSYGGPPLGPWRQAAATFVGIGALSFVVTVELRRWWWSLAFALAWGLVIALVGWFTAQYNANPTIFEWPYLAGLLAVLIAAPLFETLRDEGRRSLPYAKLHAHSWSDAVIGASGLAFTGIVFLFAWMVAGLFDLIGIEQIKKLLEKGWFEWMLSGLAFGAAVGILRERDRLLPMLQRLVRIVLVVLAPPLAAALVLFLASMPFTGLEKFWKSGIPATPLLLSAGAGAILLANTVFAEDSENRSLNPVLRWSSLFLVAVVLPLAGVAGLSIGVRIQDYGWTPERMWGVVAVAVAAAYGIAGWYAIWRGRLDFDEWLRPLQTILAIGLCSLALFLALPIVDFGAISARSQLARLENGKLPPEKFDWAAMAFDFGPSGRARLRNIANSGSLEMRSMAAKALTTKSRWNLREEEMVAGPPPAELSVLPAGSVVPPSLRQLLLHGGKDENAFCSDGGACRVYPQAGGVFVVFMDGCVNVPAARRSDPKLHCQRSAAVFESKGDTWPRRYQLGQILDADGSQSSDEARAFRTDSDALDRGDVRIAPVTRRQLMVGGKPVGEAF